MSVENIIRAWKDEVFRNSLSDTERALLPGDPAGLVELADAELAAAAGGLKCISCFDCTQAPAHCQ
jgi:mersacidin/lichenicidin family type 2 lantibiotic